MRLFRGIKKFVMSNQSENQFIELDGFSFDGSRVFIEISDDLLGDISEEISKLSILETIDFEQLELPKAKLQKFNSTMDLIKIVEADLKSEYESNLKESNETGWNSIYFLSKTERYKEFIGITVGLQYPEVVNQGTIYYSALICNYNGQFHYWDFN